MNFLVSLFFACFLVSPVFASNDFSRLPLKADSSTQKKVEGADRNYLQKKLGDKPENFFKEINHWRSEKKADILMKVGELTLASKNMLIENADEVLKTDWSSLHAMKFLDFKLNGNRTRYGAEVSGRRSRLSKLLIGELIENKGRYIPHLIDGLWLTLEESSWASPALIIIGENSNEGLPNPYEDVLDLTAGETATLVAWIKFLLKDKLDAVSPAIVKRIDYELNKRIYSPFLYSDFKWMGFRSKRTNNWNIWINKNVVITNFLAVDDAGLRDSILRRSLSSTDNFFNGYPEDGSCDEGSTYWGHAGGKLIEYIQLLQEASLNKLTFSDSKLIHRIGRFIFDTHIDGNYFVNHGDGGAIVNPPIHAIYRYGELFQDNELKGFSSYLNSLASGSGKDWIKAVNFNDFINGLFTYQEILNIQPMVPGSKRIWMPDLQQLIVSSDKGSNKGLFFAASGGHNGQSHNHNDVGSFIIYNNGLPVLIDAGVGTYTKQTFSKDRYKLWYMQSAWHNCPAINGFQQPSGSRYKATDIEVDLTQKDISSLTMDIARAYPKEAEVKSWMQQWTFHHKREEIELKGSYQLNKYVEPSDIYFLTANKIESKQSGIIRLQGKDGDEVLMEFNPDIFELIIEEKTIEDSKLSNVWGPKVQRITLRTKTANLSEDYNIVFKVI